MWEIIKYCLYLTLFWQLLRTGILAAFLQLLGWLALLPLVLVGMLIDRFTTTPQDKVKLVSNWYEYPHTKISKETESCYHYDSFLLSPVKLEELKAGQFIGHSLKEVEDILHVPPRQSGLERSTTYAWWECCCGGRIYCSFVEHSNIVEDGNYRRECDCCEFVKNHKIIEKA